MKRILSIAMSALLFLVLYTGCSAGNDGAKTEAYDNGYMSAETIVSKGEESLTSSSLLDSAAQVSRKLIKTVNLNAETEHFDDLMATLSSKITALGGYVESRESHNGSYYHSRYNRYCSMVIRIPADQLDSFVTHVNENANVTNSSETTDDITLQYVDTEAKITALETEQARLLELLANAQNLTEILEIESRLSDVTYELERYASQKRSYDNLVSYATVYLEVQEVEVLTPVEEPTVWQRMTTGFAETLQDLGDDITDFCVWFVVELPYIVIWALILTVAYLIIRRTRRKKSKKMPPVTNDPQT